KCQVAETGCMICKLPQSMSNVFSKLRPFPDPILKANDDHYMPFCEIYGKETITHLCFKKPVYPNYYQLP
ncbi:24813_t:CDS:1, partial [Gigaspora rosea]